MRERETPLDSRIRDLYRAGVEYPEPRMGLELEVEEVGRDGSLSAVQDTILTTDFSDFAQLTSPWPAVKMESDGSLRRGLELITGPLPVPNALHLARILYDVLPPMASMRTARTSTHVHVGAVDLTWRELAHVVAVYALVEPALFELYCTKERTIGTYCIPWYASAEQMEDFIYLCSSLARGRPPAAATRDFAGGGRYSALNMRSLSEHGTIEFRGAPLYAEAEELCRWIRALWRIRTAGVMYANGALRFDEIDRAESLLRMVGVPDRLMESMLDLVDEYDTAGAAGLILDALEPPERVPWKFPEGAVEAQPAPEPEAPAADSDSYRNHSTAEPPTVRTGQRYRYSDTVWITEDEAIEYTDLDSELLNNIRQLTSMLNRGGD